MAWNPPTDLEIAVTKPVKATNHRRIRDLVTALANNDSGAPRIKKEAQLNGFSSLVTQSVAGTTLDLGSLTANLGYRYVIYDGDTGNASRIWQLQFSDDGFSTTLATVDISQDRNWSTVNFGGVVEISPEGYGWFQTGSSSSELESANANARFGGFTVPAGATSARLTLNAAANIEAGTKVQVWLNGENTEA